MVKTEKTKSLFKSWREADDFVEMAESTGLTVDETKHDILTVTDGHNTGNVGLDFEEPGHKLVLMITPFEGEPHHYALNSGASVVLACLRKRKDLEATR